MSQPITKLCQYLLTTLERDVSLPDGSVIPAGSDVLLLPQTTAHSVRVPGSQSLAEAWPQLSKTGHAHPVEQAQLADFAAQLVRCADRLTGLESWAIQQGYTLPPDPKENI